MHMQTGSVAVQKGQGVAAGARLGAVGATGHADGPHLHFEIWPDGWYASKELEADRPAARPARLGRRGLSTLAGWSSTAPCRTPSPAVVDAVLQPTALAHAPHGDSDPVRAAERAAGDPDAVALIGPFRSAAVAEAVEATAPRRLPLLAPVATWAGITRDDEPGCEDEHAHHDGTIFRLVARDTVIAQRIAARVRVAAGSAHS